MITADKKLLEWMHRSISLPTSVELNDSSNTIADILVVLFEKNNTSTILPIRFLYITRSESQVVKQFTPRFSYHTSINYVKMCSTTCETYSWKIALDLL